VTWLVVALGALTAAITAYLELAQSHRRKVARRALTQVPEKQIAVVRDGEMVRLRGHAVARGPLRTSPLSQRACIGFSVTVERHEAGSAVWHRIVDKDEFATFLLADGTGEAVLHAPFEVRLDPYDVRAEDLPPAFFEFLEREGVAIRSPLGMHAFRYVETVLLPGDEIIAVGRATVEIDPAGRAPSFRDPPTRCHLKGRDEAVVIAEAEEIALKAPPRSGD
jgi:hypothetical protein